MSADGDEFSFQSGDDVDTTLRTYGRALSKMRRELDRANKWISWLGGAGFVLGALFSLASKPILQFIGSLGGR